MDPGAKRAGSGELSGEQRRLVEKNLQLAEAIAKKIRRDLPPEADLDELIAMGREGLVDAARRYDPSQSTSFSTYAYYRIRGAIYDGLRKVSYLSRAEYARYREQVRFQESANAYFADRAEEPPAESPEAEAAALEDIAVGVTAIFVTSLDAELERDRGAHPSAEDNPEEQAVAQDLHERVRRARQVLDPREGELLRLHYDEGLSLAEAARRLKVSKPWASRLHARALRALAEQLGEASSP